ncbi:MAG: hypothetical protein EA355_01825 [Rhodobacteraceae bacterium]|nr:MAG: hypothetical protein EA355_01825 [Paracoccaceae bacterium]
MTDHAIGRSAVFQSFAQDAGAWTASSTDAGCVGGVRLPIERAVYLNASSGEAVPFETVRRSFAASAQIIAPHAEDGMRFRLQAKYPLDATKPITLTAAGETFDLSAAREPAGDSVLTGSPEVLAALKRAAADGDDATFVAHSADTGRSVRDTVPPLPFDDVATCGARGAPDAALDPVTLISIRYIAAPTPETAATLEEMRVCGATEADGPVHRGTLRQVTGFASQTRDVYARFDNDGAAVQLYVPGVFEALRQPDGRWRADVSRAAAGNDPFARADVSGCLGASAVTLCEYPDGELGPCVGEFLLGDLGEEALSDPPGAWVPFAPASATSAPAALGAAMGTLTPTSFGSFLGFGGSATASRGGASQLGSPPPPPVSTPPNDGVAVIPLPPALWLVTTAFGMLLAGGHAARRSARRFS